MNLSHVCAPDLQVQVDLHHNVGPPVDFSTTKVVRDQNHFPKSR